MNYLQKHTLISRCPFLTRIRAKDDYSSILSAQLHGAFKANQKPPKHSGRSPSADIRLRVFGKSATGTDDVSASNTGHWGSGESSETWSKQICPRCEEPSRWLTRRLEIWDFSWTPTAVKKKRKLHTNQSDQTRAESIIPWETNVYTYIDIYYVLLSNHHIYTHKHTSM